MNLAPVFRIACVALLAGATSFAASVATAKAPGQKAQGQKAPAQITPGQDDWMMRMMVCEGEGVSMELYLPQSVVFADRADGETSGMRPGQTVIGYYTLDLSDVNKGKPLEPVRVTLSADKTAIIVDQYTRGLTPTRIPVKGGTVDFDQRFAKRAKCGPFQSQDPDFGNK
jgi:hypothetical protein